MPWTCSTAHRRACRLRWPSDYEKTLAKYSDEIKRYDAEKEG